MNDAIRQLERFQTLHKLIKSGCTGDSSELAMRLHVTQRMVQHYLESFRDMGARISYDAIHRTYYYENSFDVEFLFRITVNS